MLQYITFVTKRATKTSQNTGSVTRSQYRTVNTSIGVQHIRLTTGLYMRLAYSTV